MASISNDKITAALGCYEMKNWFSQIKVGDMFMLKSCLGLLTVKVNIPEDDLIRIFDPAQPAPPLEALNQTLLTVRWVDGVYKKVFNQRWSLRMLRLVVAVAGSRGGMLDPLTWQLVE